MKLTYFSWNGISFCAVLLLKIVIIFWTTSKWNKPEMNKCRRVYRNEKITQSMPASHAQQTRSIRWFCFVAITYFATLQKWFSSMKVLRDDIDNWWLTSATFHPAISSVRYVRHGVPVYLFGATHMRTILSMNIRCSQKLIDKYLQTHKFSSNEAKSVVHPFGCGGNFSDQIKPSCIRITNMLGHEIPYWMWVEEMCVQYKPMRSVMYAPHFVPYLPQMCNLSKLWLHTAHLVAHIITDKK